MYISRVCVYTYIYTQYIDQNFNPNSNVTSLFQIKEDSMLTAISSAEHSQNVAEMRRRIAELEIENQELETSNQLHMKKVWFEEH